MDATGFSVTIIFVFAKMAPTNSCALPNRIPQRPLEQTSSPFIHTGLNQVNTLAVVANGNSLMLYVNRSLLGTIPDTLYNNQGQIGVAADNNTSPTEVIFNNAKVWTI